MKNRIASVRKFIGRVTLAGACAFTLLAAAPLARSQTAAAPASATSAAAPSPTTDQRLYDIEQYFQNMPPGATADGKTKWASNIGTVPGPGHNGWMMVSTALVLFMTLPGLALFYGGLVRRKNVLSVLAQCLGIAGLVTVLWWLCGYSLVFADVGEAGGDQSTFIANFKHAFLNGVDSTPNANYGAWVSHNVYCIYQMMFAIITPALIIGAIAERMKFMAVLVFVTLWMFLIYFPLAHMVWGIDGFMNGVWNPKATIKAIDFAGGTVVHMSSGWSALVLCIILGRRIGFGKEVMAPHNMVLCMVGTGMLWVGWYGFNAGSAVAADVVSANAFMTTTLATAVACATWAFAEWLVHGRSSVLGFCSGAVAGLVVVTPACGFVDANGAIIIGICAGIIPFFAVVKLKGWLGYDDALDTFGVHAVGGTLGAFLTGVLATSKVNTNLALSTSEPLNPATQNGLAKLVASHMLWVEQLKAMGLTIVLAVVGTTVIAFIVKAVVGLRVTPEIETAGLDLSEHGEEGYILER